MSEKEKGSDRPTTESIVKIVIDGGNTIKSGNNLPTFQAPPPPPKPEKK
jgi:hypothetical protein